MDCRRKRRREEKMKEELKKLREERPTIATQFADLKRHLKDVSYEEWAGIPEVGERTGKKVRKDKYVPMPDKIIEEARKEEQVSSINVEDDMGVQSCLSSLNEVGEARGAVLSLKLDKVS